MATWEGYQYKADGRAFVLADLEENVGGDDVKTAGVRDIGFTLDVKNVGTNVQVRLEGLARDRWVVITDQKVIVGDGVYLLDYHHCNMFTRIRPYWVSKDGQGPDDGPPTIAVECLCG